MEKKYITKEMLSEKGMLDVSKYSKEDKGFYSSNEWRHVSRKYKNLHPFCEVCLNEKIEKSSESVHHITPISQGGAHYDESNLLAICKKCHGEIHTGICIRIDRDFINDLVPRESTPEDEWWASGLHDLYRDKEKEIADVINKAKLLEKNEIENSIDLYFRACRLIDDFEKILAEDSLLEKVWCQRYGVISFRYVRYPINRLSLLLEKSKRYVDCIQLINAYQKKEDKRSLPSADLKSIQKRKQRAIKKVK